MNKFYIESKAGVIMGIYEGASAEEAFEAMVADIGSGVDVDGNSTAGRAADWIIFEVVGVTHDAEYGATLYTLDNGGVMVESGPSLNYYADMSVAREAFSE